MHQDILYKIETKSLYKDDLNYCNIEVYLDCNTVYILKIEAGRF